jgi:hypothetical protein
MAGQPRTDTHPAVAASLADAVRQLPPAERLRRTLELSTLVRDATWAGAMAHVGPGADPDLVRGRFFRQLYGFDAPAPLRALLDRL